MFVRFTSDGSQTRQGFQFTATEISALGCGGTLTAPSEGTVTSPNYPDHYDNGQTCEWTITVPEGNYVHLTFGSFNLEESYDFLTIYKRDGKTASLCGAPGYPIICKSNEIFARFTSDHSGTAQGFLFSYTGVPGCGGTLTAPPGGIVKSPGSYNTDKTCEWTITVPEGSIVRLTFDSFHLDYDSDFWAIYDGDSGRAALLHSLSSGDVSVHSLGPITSTSNKMFVAFTSDRSVTAQLSQFNYTAWGCPENERRCLDGSCIPEDFSCDGTSPDCENGEDETDCGGEGGGIETTTETNDVRTVNQALTTIEEHDGITPPGDLTTEGQPDLTTPPGDLTTEGQPDLITPPNGLTTGQTDDTMPPGGTTGTATPKADDDSGASVATIAGSALTSIVLAHVVLAYYDMFG
ncbi:deleted in malignant brain tumors 1 protein-like [Branchiostoma lanceolatum]|uniref:deleted in malignant brain tumors 1 protein-like n=1 Tax=Branchiostoma lanceolatum TaxID=7740 RepID=UPI0034538531